MGFTSAPHASAVAQLSFHNKRTFAWKTIVLAVATVAFAPILLYESVLGAKVYLWALLIVHVIGIATFAWGVKKEHIAPTRRGLYGRLGGLAFTLVFLFLAEKGLRTNVGSAIFWWSLFGVWAAHTVGLVFLHVRTKGESQACPLA